MNTPKTAEMIIIGGGVMGASIAYHLIARGQKDVLLLEKGEFFGEGATGRCAGGVRYQFATEVNIRLSQASLPMLEQYQEQIGQPLNFRKCGYLFLLSQEKDVDAFRKHVELQRNCGVKTHWLERGEILEKLPVMQLDDILAGTFNDQEGIVDPNSVAMGYIRAAREWVSKPEQEKFKAYKLHQEISPPPLWSTPLVHGRGSSVRCSSCQSRLFLCVVNGLRPLPSRSFRENFPS